MQLWGGNQPLLGSLARRSIFSREAGAEPAWPRGPWEHLEGDGACFADVMGVPGRSPQGHGNGAGLWLWLRNAGGLGGSSVIGFPEQTGRGSGKGPGTFPPYPAVEILLNSCRLLQTQPSGADAAVCLGTI